MSFNGRPSRGKRVGRTAGKALLLACTAFSPVFLRAQPDHTYNYNPGRPGFACGSSALIQHTLSAEAFFTLSGGTGLPWKETGTMLNGYTLRYSPLRNMELYAGTGWVKEPGQKGPSLSPLSLGTRINLVGKQGAKPGFAFVGSVTLPVGNRSQYAVSPGVIPSMMLILDHNIGNMWVAYNAGADWNVIGQGVGLFYCVAAGGSPIKSGRFSLYGEIVGSHAWQYASADASGQRVKPEKSYAFDFRVGGDVFLTPCFKIDLSVATSLHRPHALEGEIGIAYGIPLKNRKKKP